MRPTTELPDDPALPALVAVRAMGIARALPVLGLEGVPAEVLLCGYTPGERATLDVRAGECRWAVKAYAGDPAPEVTLYRALAAAGAAGDAGPRVPPLLHWDRELRMLVIGWLEGQTTHQLVKSGQGVRAGELAATWLWRAASLPMKLGPPLGPPQILYHLGKWVAGLSAADPAVETAAKAIAGKLARTVPKEDRPRLVHGSFYDRHVLDLHDGPGVIDWQGFGQGSVEVDAGMFLATITRTRLSHPELAGEAAAAEETFLEATRGLLDERAVVWHRAAALLHLAHRRARHPERHRRGDWRRLVCALLVDAAGWAQATAAPTGPPHRRATRRAPREALP